MNKLLACSLLACMFALHPVESAEVDSISTRNIELDDSLSLVNRIFNQRIQEGIEQANASRDEAEQTEDPVFGIIEVKNYCNRDTLYAELRKSIFQSLTASWGLKGYDLDSQLRILLERQGYSLPLRDSIYRDIDFLEGFSLNLKELSDVVNIDGHRIGLDKLGHFFAEGWEYFEIIHKDGDTIDDAIAWGMKKEAGMYGYTTTGIFSFADLAANFNGWRFWNRVRLEQDDPLKSAIGNFFNRPYVSCDIRIIESITNGIIIKAWERNARFDLADYIDGAWDEGNNCNSYADLEIEDKVRLRIHEVDAEFSCPYASADCLEAREKYGAYAKYLLHPYCLAAE